MPSRMRWAQLLARIYEALPLLCPACGGEMRILSFITLPSTVERTLLHLDLPHQPPRVSPARGPPQGELDFDPSTPPMTGSSERRVPAYPRPVAVAAFAPAASNRPSKHPSGSDSPTLRSIARPEAAPYLGGCAVP